MKFPLGYEIIEYEVDDQGRALVSDPALASLELSSIEITVAACVDLLRMNEEIVLQGGVEGHTSKFQGGGKGRKRAFESESRHKDWDAFKKLLAEREKTGKYWDVILDGANVGYYKMNFGGAPSHVDFDQIEWVVQHFEGQGLRVLVVMHSRHFKGKMFPDYAKPIVERWSKNDGLLRTPMGGNDDWFWLHASLFLGLGQQEENEEVNRAKRVKGLPFFVSNDELRDHQFMMLAARDLFRWKERRAVKFSFGEWTAGRKQRQVIVSLPSPYSERIQEQIDGGLCVPHGGRKWTVVRPITKGT